MRAARIVGPGRLEVERVATPEPGPGEVLLALEGTGVCASNLPLWQGASWIQYPLAPGCGGHEAWGRVERVGAGVDARLVGRRVAALSYNAYAEYDLAKADQLVELPPSLVGRPVPGEALGCAVNIFARSDIRPGHSVAIVGVGFLGVILAKLALRAGAHVFAVSRSAHALAAASELGASSVAADASRGEIRDRVRELNGGRWCDRVIEATGKQEPLHLGAELTCEGGRLVIAGYHQDGPRSVDMQLWNWRGFDVINAHERDPRVSLRGMREAVDLMAQGVIEPEALCRDYALEELGRAFDEVAGSGRRFMKGLIRVDARGSARERDEKEARA
jgi:threonine dehydrogenase-like Zn-dependent dehydrogenase